MESVWFPGTPELTLTLCDGLLQEEGFDHCAAKTAAKHLLKSACESTAEAT